MSSSAAALARSVVPLGDLVAPHLGRAHAAARRILGCDHLAADAVQEALVVLWRQGPPPAAVRGFLARTVVHRARHLRRTLLRRARYERAATASCPEHRDCDNPLHHAFAHDLRRRLDDALAALPVEQRAAFHLHHGRGLDYADVAAALAVPLGTVRSRLHRARAALLRAGGLPAN